MNEEEFQPTITLNAAAMTLAIIEFLERRGLHPGQDIAFEWDRDDATATVPIYQFDEAPADERGEER